MSTKSVETAPEYMGRMELIREVYRLREAITEHKQGNTNMSMTNLKLWDVLPPD